MVWNPTTLRLDSIHPTEARAGTRITLHAEGVGFAEGIQLLLIAAETPQANRIVPGYHVRVVKGDIRLTGQIILENVEPGRYDVVVWNPPIDGNTGNDLYPLEKAFVVTPR